MRCFKCGRENPEDGAYCSGCGKALRTKPNQARTGLSILKGLVVVTGLTMLMAYLIMHSDEKSSASTSEATNNGSEQLMTVSIDSAPCGQNMGDVAEVVQAAKEHDLAGIAGISERKGVLFLD